MLVDRSSIALETEASDLSKEVDPMNPISPYIHHQMTRLSQVVLHVLPSMD